MRLLHIVPSYLPATRYGGPIYSVHGLCKALAAAGHDVHVFTTNVDGDKDSAVPLERPVDVDGVNVWYFPSTHLRRLYYAPSMRRAMSNELKSFDLVHLHSIFLWPTWAAAREARRVGVPYVISPRGMLVRDLVRKKSRFIKSAWIKLIEKKNLEMAAAVHVTSEMEKQEASKFGFRFPPFVVIPNGINDDLLNNQDPGNTELTSGLLKKGPYILFLGRINWKKGLDRLIPALQFVPDARLVVAGNDEEDYQAGLEGLAKKYGTTDRITFVGPVYGREKAALLKNAAVFILPSHSENFGNTVLEAMAMGCPVVVTPEVGLADTVQKTGAGLVIEGDPEKLGRGIRDLLDDAPLRQRMGRAGHEAVLTRFTGKAVADEMEQVYQGVTKKNIRRG